MGVLHHTLLIPIGLLITIVSLKMSGLSIYQTNVELNEIDKEILTEIDRVFQITLRKIADFHVDLPSKIVLQRMENVSGNTFNDSFLVGNSHEVKASYYMSQQVAYWCSGLVSRRFQKYTESEKHRIHVVFDCNRPMMFSSFRSVIRFIIIILFTSIVCVVIGCLARSLELRNRRVKIKSIATTAPFVKLIDMADDVIVDDDSAFIENMEEWDMMDFEFEE